ncbi:Meiotically up-regulated protein 86 protein [Malassezia pachydermatis]|uniref:Gpr fun34 family protein n=1 Tax=Malassezia pachydermatis TaxID=77020 RepID=A0A0M8MT80_9BASI|nr:gpr fun34 family protein [Malassezia pachydermatis]KOS16277.1 gpr fun34 family protein [Malassezia pachydermatis]
MAETETTTQFPPPVGNINFHDNVKQTEMRSNSDAQSHFYNTELARVTSHMTHDERDAALNAARFGYGPLSHLYPANGEGMHRPFGGEMQPGLFKSVEERKLANPAPLGLSAFALTTFVLSLINLGTLDLTSSAIIISLGFAYGGFVQICAGMWEMAVGNTFGATALTSYGGFWVSFAIILTPGGFHVMEQLKAEDGEAGVLNNLGLYLFSWFIFTFLLLLCTLKSTVMFFLLFFLLDLTFLLLGCAYLRHSGGAPHTGLLRAGGAFGVLTAFAAWYNAYAGIANDSNTFLVVPAIYFPWSPNARKVKADKKIGEDAV